jgi:hypothetical protein
VIVGTCRRRAFGARMAGSKSCREALCTAVETKFVASALNAAALHHRNVGDQDAD